MEKTYKFGSTSTENKEPVVEERQDVRPFRELKIIKSKKSGQIFIVTRIGHETILPVSYYERMVENAQKREEEK